jgi:glucose-6-phosphate isomerase
MTLLPHQPWTVTPAGAALLTALDAPALAALLDLAQAAGVPAFRDAMAAGEAVNATEGRAALHMALRGPRGRFMAGAEDASASVAPSQIDRFMLPASDPRHRDLRLATAARIAAACGLELTTTKG